MQRMIIIALAAFFLTNLLRRLPWIEMRAMTGVRPWSCNACMSFWTMAPAALTVHFGGDLADPMIWQWPLYLGASGLCFFLLEVLEPNTVVLPPPPPPAPGADSE